MPHDFLELEEEQARAEAERRKREAVAFEEPGMKPMVKAFRSVVTVAKLAFDIEKKRGTK